MSAVDNVQPVAPENEILEPPAELRELQGWVMWRSEKDPNNPNGKPLKVPYYAKGGKRHGKQGSVSDRGNLTSFAAAKHAASMRGFDGVGLALMPEFGITALDFDNCVDADGKLPPEITEIASQTYAEFSPSGKGIRAFVRGVYGNNKSPTVGNEYGFETFSSTGFVTFTGNAMPYTEFLDLENTVADLDGIVAPMCEARFKGSRNNTFDPDDFMAGREPKLGLTLRQMEDLVNALDPDMGREDWIKVGMALGHETEGDDTGFDIWNEWSSKGSKYPSEEALRTQWDSFERRKAVGQRQVTMATVIKMAKEATGFIHHASPTAPAGPVPASGDRASIIKVPDPFPGVMSSMVEAALATAPKPQKSLTTLAALIGMAGGCNGHYQMPSGLRPNLYGLGVAPTGSGKDHALKVAKAVADASGGKLFGEAGSGQGLEDNLESYTGTLAVIDEIAHELAATGNPNAPSHLRAAEGMYLKLFSESAGNHQTRLLAGKSSKTIAHPCLSMIGFATPEGLGMALGEGSITSGLMGRMLMAEASTCVPSRRIKDVFTLPEDVKRAAPLIARAPAFAFGNEAETSIAIGLTPEAEAKLDGVLAQFDKATETAASEGERALLARSYEKVERICAVLAIWETPKSPVVTLEMVNWASSFVNASDTAMLHFVRRYMHGGPVQANAARIVEVMEKVLRGGFATDRPSENAAINAGYVPRSFVLRLCKSMDKKDLTLAIDHLVEQGNVVATVYKSAESKRTGIAVLTFPSEEVDD